MAQQFSAEWARGIIDGGVNQAKSIIESPEQIDDLLVQLQDKLKGLPEKVVKSFENIPLMAEMVKSYVTREYTEVSPKVVISLVSAFLYLVKKKDLIPDDIPIVGYADDVAVVAIAMAINEPELKAFAEWRALVGKDAASAQQSATLIEGKSVSTPSENELPNYEDSENSLQE